MIRAMIRDSRSGMSGRDDWGLSDQGEVNHGIGHQVGLELCQVNVEGTIKTERNSDGGDNLTCSSWCRLAFQCQDYDGKCHRWLHCQP